MKKKLWLIPFFAGIILILGAAGLCIYNIHENETAFRHSQEVMTELRELIPEPKPNVTQTTSAAEVPSEDLFAPYENTSAPDEKMPAVVLYGEEYCGYITLPELGLELPVMNGWSYERLKSSPCCYSGTADGNDLIIAAHNYNSHFGRIKELSQGDEISFTGADGRKYLYRVEYTENIEGRDVERMFSGKASDWDLTLFTCTLSGQSRVTVRASRTE